MANILQTYLDKYGGQSGTTKNTAGMGTHTGSVNQSGNVLANYFSKYGDGTSQAFTGFSSPQQQWENMYQQYVAQYDMQQRAMQSLANTYRNTYEGMKRTNKEASRMTFDPMYAGYVTDELTAANMNTNANYGKRVSDDELVEMYRQWQEAEAKANETRSVGDYWKFMYKFHNDADKVVADYDKRIAAMESDPNLKREASVAGSGNRELEALKAERDAFIQTNTQYKNAAEDYTAILEWAENNPADVASYKRAKEVYDAADAKVKELEGLRDASKGFEIHALGAEGGIRSATTEYDEDISAAIRERDRAKAVMDYAYANRYADLLKSEDVDVTADKGKEAFESFLEEQASNRAAVNARIESNLNDDWASTDRTEEGEEEEYVSPYDFSIYDPNYSSNYADQNENWSDDEKRTFYYLFASNREAAFRYGNEVNQRYASEEESSKQLARHEWLERDAGHAVLASLATIPANILAGADYIRMLEENKVRGGVYESQYGGFHNYSNDVRGYVGSELNRYGTISDSFPFLGGKGWGDAYQLLMSMGDSAVAVAAGGGVANAVFFGSAAASATTDALERGLAPDKALAFGFASGLAEVAGETFSVENLLRKDTLIRKGLAAAIMQQGLTEGSEEMVTTLINTFADALINGDKRELQQKIDSLAASGMSYEDAKKRAWLEWAEELGVDAIGGLLSGSLMSAVHSGMAVADMSNREYSGDAQALFDLAELTDEGSESRALAGRYKDAFDAYKAALEAQGTDTGTQTVQEQAEEAVQDEATQGQERVARTEEKAAEKPMPKAEPRTGISALKGARLETALAKDLGAKDRSVLEEKATARLTDLGVENAGKAASAVVDRVLGSEKGAIGRAVSGLNFNDSRVRIVLQELTEQLAGQKTSASWLGNTELMTVGQDNAWTRTIENGLKQVRVKGSSERSKVTGATMANGKLNLTIEQDGKPRTLSQDQLDLSDSQQRALGLLTRVLGDDAANAYDGMTIGNMGDVLQVMRYASAFGTVRDVLGRAGVKDDAALASPLRKGLTDAQVLRALAAGRKRGPVPEGQRAISRRGTGAVSLEGGTLDGRKLGGVKNREAVTNSQRYKTIKRLAEELGIDVVLYESDEADDKGNLEDAPHGAYKDGVIWLDWNAGVYNVNKFNNKEGMRDYSSEAEALIFLTMSHELTHFLEQNAEKEYNELRDFITQYMADNGKDFNGMVRRKLAEQSNIDHDEAVREVIADACQTMLVDSKYVEQLINEKPTLWERIRDWIRNFFGFAKTQAKGPEFEAIRDVAAQISELWDRALQVAVESRLSEETLQQTPTIKEQAAANILTREQQQAILDEAKSRGVRTDKMADLYRQRDTVRNTPSQQTPLMLPAHEYTAKEKAAIKRRFNKAVEEMMDSYLFDGIDLSREQAEQMVREYAAAHDGYFSLMDEAKQTGRNKTRKQMAEAERNAQEGGKARLSGRNQVDRDYLAAVERGDMETAQRMVDRAAKDAGYTVHGYHGTGQRFTVFDKKKINSVWGINGGDLGFYFTPYKSDAEGYASYAAKGGNGYVVNAYLKMDNPLIVEDTGWGSAARQADIRNGDLKRWAKQGNNDGIIVRSIDEEMYDGFPDTVYVVFDSDQIKTADPVTYDDAGNVIPLSERFNSGNPDIRYSARTGGKSDRELLLDASDASLTDAEQKARAAYRAQVDGYRSRQQAVVTLIDAMDKAVRDGDATAATKLRAKLTEAEKKMAQALAGLTEAERGPELREILRREREIQRRRTDSRIRESYGRRELRQKVDRLWKDLTKRLSSPSEKKNIPVNVMMQAVDVLEAINMDATRADSKAGQKLRDRLNELKSRYNALKNDQDFRQAAMYDPQVAEFLDNMIETVGDTPINRMSAQQLAAVYNTLKALDHVARGALKVRLRTMEYSAYDISKRMTEETRSVGKKKAGAIDMFLNAGLSPARMFNRLGGYHKDSTWSQVYEMLNEGQLRQTQLQVEGSMLFEDLLAAKDYGKFVDPKNTVDVGLKDADGKTIEITHGMLVSLYMHLMNEQNRRHVAYGGLTIPGLTDYYNGKKIKGTENAKSAAGVLQEIAEINDKIRETDDPALKEALEAERDAAAEKAMSYLEELQKAVEGKLTEYDRKWIAACRELFDGFSKRALNEATMQVYGIKRANVENYFPIWVDGNFLNTPFESVAKDFSLENAGFMKERVDSAKPIRLADVSDVAASQIRKVAQYAGLMPVIHDFNKIWGKTQTGYRDSVRQAVMQTYGQSGVNYIENLMADLNGARGMENSPLGEMLNRLRGHMAQASLTLSLRTAMGQAASYPTAASVLGWEPLAKALAHGGKNNTVISRADQELILKWSPLLKYRLQGYRDPELGQIAQMNSKFDRVWKKARWATGWIQAADGATVGRLWYACEYYVQDHNKDLKKGTDAYYEAVAKKFNEVVELTQPNYTTMQRPDILRNPNALVRQLTMFLTQRLQNFNIMYDAAATYSQMRKDRAAGKYGVTNEDVRQAGIRTRTAALSQITAAATIVAFKFLADVILHSMNAYRDDDDELTKESVSAELLDMFLDSLAGNVLGGGELYDLIESKAFGKTYYGIEVSGVSTVTDALKAVNDFYDKVAKGEVSWKEADKLAKKISVIAGIPYANAEKIIRGGIWHVQDMINGEFGSFEAGVDRTTGQQAHRLWRAYDAKDFAQAKKIRDEAGDDDKLNQALAAYIKKQYADGKINKFEAQRQLEKYAGKDKETAEKTMREYSSEVETGIKFSQIEDSFLLGDITAQKAQQMLVKYGGLDAQTAKMKVDFWGYQNKNPGTKLEFSSYKTYVSKYQGIGLTVAQYESYSERLKDCRGVDADGDGKTDSGSKKAEVVKLIDSMSLTPAQKDQLYYANNYGASGLKDTPWHN